jgi:hypothetical protein
LIISLVLSAFTHMWNPIGFPYFHGDEGHYMRRAMYVLEGFGPQEQRNITWSFEQPYDHPYFGQIFLATVLGLIGYPDILDLKRGDVVSIEMLHIVPRLLMGILAVVDTFLIYKIAERRYGRNVAFVAAALFAVMPMSWLIRRILLDSLSLPFILLSILFAMHYNKKKKNSYSSSSSILSSSISSSIPKTTISSSSSSSSSLTTYENEGSNNNIKNNKKNKKNKSRNNNNISLVILSGIFLGLAIFTKIPAFTMIPLIGYLIIISSSSSSSSYTTTNENSNKNNDVVDNNSTTIGRRIKRRIIITNLRNLNLKALGLWFIPVILIPAIWPVYAISIGEFDSWLDGVAWQTHRQPKLLWNTLNAFFQMDPFLFIGGIVGIIFAAVIKRDFILLAWVIPYLAFLYLIGYAANFHLILLIPIFCIAAAKLIVDISTKIISNKTLKQVLPFAIISAIGIFGLISTILLITTNVSSFQYKVTAFLVQHLLNNNKVGDHTNNDITILGTSSYFWIPKDIFQQQGYNYKGLSSKKPIETEKTILVVDRGFRNLLSSKTDDGERLRTIYDGTDIIATTGRNSNIYDIYTYPYTNMRFASEDSKVELRTN